MIDTQELSSTAARLRELYDAQLYREARGLAHRVAGDLPEPSLKEGLPELKVRADFARALALVGEGRWAKIHMERARQAAERALGAKHPEIAGFLIAHAQVLAQVVYYPEIEPLLKRAVAIREEACGPDHRDTAQALLAWAELAMRHWHAYLARPLARRARAILEPLVGSLDPTVLRARELLVLSGRGTTPAPKLVADLADLVHLRERVQGAEHLDVARALEPAIELEPELDGAGRAYDRTRSILVKALGEAHPRVALVDAVFAERAMKGGDGPRAIALIGSALTRLERAWEADHPDRMPVYGRLTMLLVWAEPSPETDAFKERLKALKDLEKK